MASRMPTEGSIRRSDTVFQRLCRLPPYTPLPILNPSTFDFIFQPSTPAALSAFIWTDVIPPPLYHSLGVLRKMSVSPLTTMSDLPSVWASADNNFAHYDTIFHLIVSDPRLDPQSEGRAWTLCRTVVTLEQCLVQSTFRGHLVLEKAAKYMKDGLGWELYPGETEMLLERSKGRVRSTLLRTAARLRFMMVSGSPLAQSQSQSQMKNFTLFRVLRAIYSRCSTCWRSLSPMSRSSDQHFVGRC